MRQMAIAAIFYFVFSAVFKIPAALFAQKIQRAKTKQAIKFIAVRYFMAGEIFALAIFEKFMTVFHTFIP